jgi:hypothetical protein
MWEDTTERTKLLFSFVHRMTLNDEFDFLLFLEFLMWAH